MIIFLRVCQIFCTQVYTMYVYLNTLGVFWLFLKCAACSNVKYILFDNNNVVPCVVFKVKFVSDIILLIQ